MPPWVIICNALPIHVPSVIPGITPARPVLPALSMPIALLVILFLGAFIYLIGIIGSIGLVLMNEDFRTETNQIFVGGGAVFLLVCVLSVLRRIIRAKPLFDYYRSCKPRMGTVFLMFSILFPVTVPVFTFLCRKDDNGIPNPEPESLPPEGEDIPE